MNNRIAIITTEFFKDFLKKSFKEMDLEFSYLMYCYESFDDLSEIFRQIPDDIHVVLASGSYPYNVLKNQFPDTEKKIRLFNSDHAAIYKLLLNFANEGKDFQRIFADILDVIDTDPVSYLTEDQKKSYTEILEEKLEDVTPEQFLEMEKKYLNKHISLWKEGKTDLSVTRFSSIVPALKTAGIPVYFPYPTMEYLKSVCTSAIQEVQIYQIRRNLPGAIVASIDRKDYRYGEAGCEQLEQLQNKLVQYGKNNLLDFTFHPTTLGFEISTNHEGIYKLTDNQEICKLKPYCDELLDFNVYIGYGLGNNMNQARINAIDANREARNKTDGTSCLINEKDMLVFSLSAKKQKDPFTVSVNITPEIQKISEHSGLTTFTLQKIFTVVQHLKEPVVTSKELALELSITKRSANRFLGALVSAGAAKIETVKGRATKGRPEHVYKIHIPKNFST